MGLRGIKGRLLQFLDADDIIDPRKFELQVKAMSGTTDKVICISDYYYSKTDDLAKPYDRWYLTPIFRTNNHLDELIRDWQTKLSIPIHCFLFSSSFFGENGVFFNESLPNHVDWECWLNIFRLKPEVRYVDLKLAVYRIQPNGISSDKVLMKNGYLQAITIQQGKFEKDSKEYKLLLKKYTQIKYDIDPDHIFFVNGRILIKNITTRIGKMLSPENQV
jgi:hypothetical protein